MTYQSTEGVEIQHRPFYLDTSDIALVRHSLTMLQAAICREPSHVATRRDIQHVLDKFL